MLFVKLLNIFQKFLPYLSHSISSGQLRPKISMSWWHSARARWHRRRHGSVMRPYSVHTGV